MIKEEAKKMGATHYFMHRGIVVYCKYTNDQLCVYDHDLGWLKAYTDIKPKPLQESKMIKENAPVGATHYTTETNSNVVSFWRIHNGTLQSWSKEDGWLSYPYVKSHREYILSIWKPL